MVEIDGQWYETDVIGLIKQPIPTPPIAPLQLPPPPYLAAPTFAQPTSVSASPDTELVPNIHPTSRPANHSAMVTALNTESTNMAEIVDSHDLEISKFLAGDDSKHIANLAANLIKLQSHIDRCDARYAACEDVDMRKKLREERKDLHQEYRETVEELNLARALYAENRLYSDLGKIEEQIKAGTGAMYLTNLVQTKKTIALKAEQAAKTRR